MPNYSLDLERHFDKPEPRVDGRYITECLSCGAQALDIKSIYCHECGGTSLKKRRVDDMLYKSIQTTAQGKALVCPHCDNEELNGGDYCMICGNEVVNRCSDVVDAADGRILSRSCQNVLPGNARYCPRCGNESTFYQRGWLRDWKSENVRKAIQNIHVSTVNFEEVQQDKASV